MKPGCSATSYAATSLFFWLSTRSSANKALYGSARIRRLLQIRSLSGHRADWQHQRRPHREECHRPLHAGSERSAVWSEKFCATSRLSTTPRAWLSLSGTKYNGGEEFSSAVTATV